MSVFLIYLVFCYILFLYSVYKLGREDFVLIRRNIALEQLFNLTFLTSFIMLLSGRIFYVLFHFNVSYLNPLKFFVLPYFPGLLLPGAVAGAFLFLWVVYRRKKTPSGRLIDFYSQSLLLIMPFLMLGETIILPRSLFLVQLALAGVYVIVYLIYAYFFMEKVSRGEMKDGTMGLIFLGILAIISFLQDSVLHTKGMFYFLTLDDFFYLFILAAVIFLLLFHEFWFPKKK